MTEKPSGGSAFPLPPFVDGGRTYQYPEAGMTLRQWYAGQALAGIMANPESPTDENGKEAEDEASVAKVAFAFADAMIAEGSK